MLDSSVAEVCQRVSASQAACPVSIAEEGFCNLSWKGGILDERDAETGRVMRPA